MQQRKDPLPCFGSSSTGACGFDADNRTDIRPAVPCGTTSTQHRPGMGPWRKDNIHLRIHPCTMVHMDSACVPLHLH
jgi:hypothetical protein